MKAAKLLVECLEEEGVKTIYGIPGEENLEFMDCLRDSSIEFVLTRHEQAAAFMAATEGRLTSRPGVCLSTLGPGATNLVTGVADSYLSNFPMIALCAQAGASRCYPPQKQVIDLVSLFRPITKEVMGIRDAGSIPVVVRRAFDMSTQDRPGPIMIELPEDIMRQDAEGKPLQQSPSLRGSLSPNDLSSMASALERARRPLVIIGHGVVRSGAEANAIHFCRSWGIPAAHTWLGNGVMPWDDRLSLNTIGMRNSDLIRDIYKETDLVILIGYDVTEFQPQFWNVGEKKTIIHIGDSHPGVARGLTMDMTAIGNMKGNLDTLSSFGVRRNDNWAIGHRESLEAVLNRDVAGPQGLVATLRDALDTDDILVSDVGAHLIWLAKFYPSYKSNTLLLQNGLISMGVGIPSAIAAKRSHPDRNVVAVCGDGGFLMSAAELETSRRIGAPITVVIFNDNGLGLIKEKMLRTYGRYGGVDLDNPDMVLFAEAFGADGYRVDDAADFDAVLHECLGKDRTCVIDVRVDYSFNNELF